MSVILRAFGRIAAHAAAASALAACTAMPPASDAPPLDGTVWTLVTMAGKPPVEGTAVTMGFDAGRVQGTNSCNRYTAPYTTAGTTLQIDPRAATPPMACSAPLRLQGEAFMRVLGQTRGWRVAGGQLQLLAAEGAVLASFAAQPRTLGGTSWRVTGYNDGRQAVVSVLAGTTLTMAFATDGRLSGSSGCNRYTAAYSGDEQKLQIVPVDSTRMTCAAPERVMEQEQQFLAALASVARARFEGERVELRTADGALAIAMVRERAP